MKELCPRVVKDVEGGGVLTQVSRSKTFTTITASGAQCKFRDGFFCNKCGGTVYRE